MKLPEEFAEKMRDLLGAREYGELEASFSRPRYFGLRVNTLKISVEDFLRITPFRLEPVPWSKDGFYYRPDESPGKHPHYHAGLYYIQEPSAMLPAEVLDARPGERVLDLCAAPGGKTVRIAAGMRGEGLLVANDINADRVKALVKNIELCGVRNAVVTNSAPEILADRLGASFDRILVDAPCSGEGMFRKDEEAVKSWGRFKCEACSKIQAELLEDSGRLLREGGIIVYSTCTFSPEEDEIVIAEFLMRHPEYELEEIPKCGGMEAGRPEWAGGAGELAGTVRLWPHRLRGEGHFTARLRKGAAGAANQAAPFKGDFQALPRPFLRFAEEHLKERINGSFGLLGGRLYLLPCPAEAFEGIRVSKFGWFLGTIKEDRFEPSHSLATALDKRALTRIADFPSSSPEVMRYLRGETLMLEGEKGYTAVCVDGYTLGWAKQTGDMLKNLYPKGWRRMS